MSQEKIVESGEGYFSLYKRYIGWAFTLILAILLLANITKIIIYNPSGQILVRQAFWFGTLSNKSTPGFWPRLWGDLWKFKRETSVKFTNKEDEKNVTTRAIFVRYNDGGTGYMGGTARFKFPLNDDIYKVVRVFGGMQETVRELVIPLVREVCTSTSGLLATEESYTTKRSMISPWCFDQAKNGVYLSQVRDEERIDEFGKTIRAPVYERRKDETGNLMRQPGVLKQFGIECTLFKVPEIDYLGDIDTKISEKMKWRTELQVTNADIQKFEQYLNEVEAEGKRLVKEAEMQQRKVKEEKIQKVIAYYETELLSERADSLKTVNLLLATKDNVKAAVKEAEGEAAQRRKSMQGDQALDRRLQAYQDVMKAWYAAISEREQMVPKIASNWDPLFSIKLLDMVDKQVRTDLGLNFRFGR